MSPRRQPPLARRIGERDAALRRLRRVTAAALAVAGALAAVFGGLAAKAFPGRSGHPTANAVTQASTVRVSTTATPPPLVSAGSPAPAPAAQAPVQSQAPPVVVSGGT